MAIWRHVRYYGLKILQFALILFLISLVVFVISRLAPGDPLRAFYGDGVERMSTEERQAAEERLGLDKPILEQYGIWLENAFHGDFGISFQYKQDVLQVIGNVYGNTLLLGGVSYVLTFALAIGLGVFCAMREDSLVDRIICKIGAAVNCMPSFLGGAPAHPHLLRQPAPAAQQRRLRCGYGGGLGQQTAALDFAGGSDGAGAFVVLCLYDSQ